MNSHKVFPPADELLQLAEKLLALGAGEVSQAAVRRAVSTAYYAVFHRFCELCADALVGKDRSGEAYVAIYRSLDHGPLRNALSQIEGADTALSRVFDGFRELQDARYWADYNPSARRTGDSTETFPQEKATEYIEFARAALATLAALDDERRLTLAAQLVGKIRGKSK